MGLLRKFFFYFFIFIYLIICPIAILYSFGYVFNPLKDEFVQTGLIALSSVPGGANIYLDNSRYTQNTPALIRELLPGSYPVTVLKKEHRPWKYSVRVEAGEAAVFDKIVLLPVNFVPERMSRGKYERLRPFENVDQFLVLSGDTLAGVYVCDISQGEDVNVFTDPVELNAKLLDVFTVKGAANFIALAGSPAASKYFYVNAGSENDQVKDITDLVREKPAYIFWDKDNPLQVFAVKGDDLDRLDISAGSVYPNYITGIKGAGAANGLIYVIKKDNSLLSYKSNDNINGNVLIDGSKPGSVDFAAESYRVYLFSDNQIFFLADNGGLLSGSKPHLLAESGIIGMEYAPQRQHLLFWSKNAIYVLDLNAGTDEIPLKQTVYTQGKDVRQCFWAYDGSHILFKDADNIYFLEMRAGSGVKIKRIFSADSAVYYSKNTGDLFYIDLPGGNLSRINIIAKDKVIDQPFKDLLKEKDKPN